MFWDCSCGQRFLTQFDESNLKICGRKSVFAYVQCGGLLRAYIGVAHTQKKPAPWPNVKCSLADEHFSHVSATRIGLAYFMVYVYFITCL